MLSYNVNDDAKGDRYVLGVELAASQLRIAALAQGAEPTLSVADAFARTRLYAVGSMDWDFEPQPGPSPGNYEVSSEQAETVRDAIGQFLEDRQIGIDKVSEIRFGVIIGFDEQGRARLTDTDLLLDELGNSFGTMKLRSANRTRDALRVEHRYGAGLELKPAHNMVYVTLSRNLNFDALVDDTPVRWGSDGIFAPGIRHAHVDLEDLEQSWPAVVGEIDYEAPELANCPICKKKYCLHLLASGQGIVDLVARRMAGMSGAEVAETHVGRAMAAREQQGAQPFVQDRGAVAKVGRDGVAIDTAAVFRASRRDPACQLIINQAGVALGMVIVREILQSAINIAPQLIVLGGAIPAGTEAEDLKSVEERDGIDAVVQRVLASHGFTNIRVSRSRFSGFTGLLGVTLLPESAGQGG